jgi:hypothetical protein
MATPPVTTSVPFPVFGPNGFLLPDESDVLIGTQRDLNAAFANKLNFTTADGARTNPTPQGVVSASQAAVIGDSFAMFLWFINNVDPAYSSGRMQDAIGRLYFIARHPGTATLQPCICTGLTGLTIPLGSLVQDPNGVLWISQQDGTIGNIGSVIINFACTVNGPTPPPDSLEIYQAIGGWDSIAPQGAALLGQDEESSAQFETRRALSTGLNSMGPLNAVYAAVGELDGVLDVYVTENTAPFGATIGGVFIGAHSMYICVLGGDQAEIAKAILTRKMPGCGMAGNVTTTIADPNPLYFAPVPTYQITYQSPAIVNFYVVVNLTNSMNVPSTAGADIANAVMRAFAGLDGGPRAKIGSMVYASRYYAPIASLSTVVNAVTGLMTPGWSSAIVGITLGRKTAGGTFTASIASNTLTVTAILTGGANIAVGDVLTGTNVADGTVIIGRITGTGGTGSYLLNTVKNVASTTITRFPTGLDVQMNINEAPAVNFADVILVLS